MSIACRGDNRAATTRHAAGCGAMLKDYGHHFEKGPHAEIASAFAKKLKDVSEFLVELGPVKPTHPLRLRATYHDACHGLRELGLKRQGRALLSGIEGLDLVAQDVPSSAQHIRDCLVDFCFVSSVLCLGIATKNHLSISTFGT